MEADDKDGVYDCEKEKYVIKKLREMIQRDYEKHFIPPFG